MANPLSLLTLCIGTLLLRCAHHVAYASQSTRFTDPTSGKTYDLSAMTRKGSDKDFQKSVQVGSGIQFMYRINVGESTVQSCNSQQGAVTESLILAGGETCRVLGRTDGMVLEGLQLAPSPGDNPNGEGVRIKYTNGDVCDPVTSKKREAWVEISCSESSKPSSFDPTPTEQAGDLVEMQKTDTCKTVFQMKSYFACSVDSRGDGEGGILSDARIFCYVFFFSLTIYCVLGALYRYKALGLRGKDVVPNRVFWEELPGLVKDGASYSKVKIVALVQKVSGKTSDSAEDAGLVDDDGM